MLTLPTLRQSVRASRLPREGSAASMDCEMYARVRRLFAEAMELSPGERQALLHAARQRKEDEEVLREVESLLAFHRASDRTES